MVKKKLNNSMEKEINHIIGILKDNNKVVDHMDLIFKATVTCIGIACLSNIGIASAYFTVASINTAGLINEVLGKIPKQKSINNIIERDNKVKFIYSILPHLSLRFAYEELHRTPQCLEKFKFQSITSLKDSVEYNAISEYEINNITKAVEYADSDGKLSKEKYWSETAENITNTLVECGRLRDENADEFLVELIEKTRNFYDILIRKFSDESSIFKNHYDFLMTKSSMVKMDNIYKVVSGDTSASKSYSQELLTKNIPVSKYFEGRKSQLDSIRKKFGERSFPIALTGIGGIGKTEIAKKYFHDNKGEYDYYGWINYENSLEESFLNSFDISFDFTIEDTNEDKYNKIKRYLNNLKKKVLLVIDNFDSNTETLIEEVDLLNGFTYFDILITTRDVLGKFDEVSIGSLSEKELLYLFKKYCEYEIEEDVIKEIINRAGKLTLVVELLAKTANELDSIEEVKMMVAELKSSLDLNSVISDEVESNRKDLDKDLFFNHLKKLFAISKINNDELNVLMKLSLLPRRNNAKVLNRFRDNDSKVIFNKQVIKKLVSKGWVSEFKDRDSGKTYEIHPIIYELIQIQTNPNVENCIDVVTSLRKQIEIVDVKEYYTISYLIEYLKILIDYHNNNQTDMTVFFCTELSLIYQSEGRFEEALQYSLIVKVYNNDNSISLLDKAGNYTTLATLYIQLHKYDEALQHAIEAKDMCEGIENAPTDEVKHFLMACYSNLSLILRLVGDCKNALQYAFKANKLIKENYGDENPELATNLNNISLVYADKNQYDFALKYAKKSKTLMLKLYDDYHPELATCYNSIAVIYTKLNRFDEALIAFMASLNILNKIHYGNHYTIATCYENISNLYSNIEEYEKSIINAKYAVEILIKEYGDDYLPLVTNYDLLSNSYLKLGNEIESLKYAEIAQEVLEKNDNINNIFFRHILNNLSVTYYNIGVFEKALNMALKYEDLLKKEHLPGLYNIDRIRFLRDIYYRLGNNIKVVELNNEIELLINRT